MDNFVNVENIKKLLLKKGIVWSGNVFEDGCKSKERPAIPEDFAKPSGYPAIVEMLYLDNNRTYSMLLKASDVCLEIYQEIFNRGKDEDELILIEQFSEDWQQQNLAEYGKDYVPCLKAMIERNRTFINEEFDAEIARLKAELAKIEEAKKEQLKPLQDLEDGLRESFEEEWGK